MTSLLVVRLSALGDVVHTVPAAVALRRALPETRFAWVVEAPYRELVELVAEVEAIPVSMKRWGRQPLRSRREMRDARRKLRSFDVTVDFQGLIKSAALAALTRAPHRWGFDREAIRERAALLLTNHRAAVDVSRHVVEQNLQLASAVAGKLLEMPLVDFSRFCTPFEGIDSLRQSIVLIPGAGRPEKQWPVENFRALARAIGEKALSVWGPGEEERARSIGGRIAPPTNLRQLAAILLEADLVIGGDTGPLHLAAALGTPVIGLYGPTNPRRNGPYGQMGDCISRYDTTRTMQSISVEEVMEKLKIRHR